MSATNIKLFAGNACPALAENVAKSLLLEMSDVTVCSTPLHSFVDHLPACVLVCPAVSTRFKARRENENGSAKIRVSTYQHAPDGHRCSISNDAAAVVF